LQGLGTVGGGSNTVIIPGAYASYPINQGLTSAGLSNWSTSSHESWSGYDTDLWTAININGSGDAVTLVSKATGGGGTTIPDATSTMGLLALAVAGMMGLIRRNRR
jgi:hypothetical protein